MSNKFIRSLTIENFKSIKQLNGFELRNINILIGSNGAGKSNFLNFFDFLRAVLTKSLRGYVASKGKADGVLTFGRKQNQKLIAEISFEKNSYGFELVSTEENSFYFEYEYTKYFTGNYSNIFPYRANYSIGGEEAKIADRSFNSFHTKYFVPQFGKILQYHFHDVGENSPIKTDCSIVDIDKLLFNGKNIAPFLRRLKLDYPDSYEMILNTIRMVVPDFHEFYFREDLKSDDLITLLWINKNDRESILHPRMLSDGSLRFICLATVLLQPLDLMPEIVIIDEPELGLHPQALALIASLVQRLSLQKQFIIATQSSNFIDLFEAHDIVVVNKNLDGSSEFIRLDEDELSNWLDEYSLADLWDMNIIGGRP